ncbi:4-(cytidine 5'-diphospho)-2-C-methyl-D-erythritol kinase [Streptomyces marispadix]|uniref:4-diphosphocytidyl-2-C-methyl-D-erythritol kinase n=1 Tax=Streptomyces marispadix TaxID=2922868 RepID=A0ABS9SWT1_9ACTN|nr:4-(cytidine 5'-diphospho)-2-C-methyl-D-erythritol kinase [Streptomyces marispadix]MCH6160742.1 4-(cytidine 5'-diphospho)-2-C-methyl-D-erythritol kinase [Streptomyces marispadix]
MAGDSATARVPAKVNVQLAVGGLRPDGFHGLANVFLAVGLYDEVTASHGDGRDDGSAEGDGTGRQDCGHGVRLTVSGRDAAHVPLDESNLAVRAARLLAERHGREPRVRLHITKDIPVAGGMAGGSADAAGALLACDALWGTHTPQDELRAMCAELGSDVPFSLVGGAALGQGRGELLTPLETGGTFHWVFALADGGLSTPAVYRECDRLREAAGTGADVDSVPEPRPSALLLDALRSGDAEALAAAVSNDLQAAAVSLRPSLSDTLKTGTAAGALAALVSGSGPTCAFLAGDAGSAARIAAALEESGHCRSARTTTAPAPGARLLPA